MGTRIETYGKHWVGGGGHNALDITGIRVHFLTVIERTNKRRSGQVLWRCRCDCGRDDFLAKAHLLKVAGVQSCGCKTKELQTKGATKHGMSRAEKTSRTHKIWSGILERCNNPNSAGYQWYGGRGITVCERWKTFELFFVDMGIAPAGMSIDRIDNDGRYEPGNCRWATSVEQNRNRRSNRLLTVGKETKVASEWAELMGMKQITLYSRLKDGWSDEDAVLTPVRGWRKKR